MRHRADIDIIEYEKNDNVSMPYGRQQSGRDANNRIRKLLQFGRFV